MANKDNSERIEKFLREQMTSEENEAFLNDFRNDKDLREEAQMMALLIKEMKEEQAKQSEKLREDVLAAQLGNAARKVDPVHNVNLNITSSNTVRMVRWSLSIAAMFILIFGATLLWNRQSDTDKLFNEYYSAYTIDHGPIKGGDSSNVEEELAVLFNQVGTEKDVSIVIAKLQKIYDSIDSEYEYSLFTDDIAWYLALAYLKDGKPEKAKELLNPLAANGNEKAIAIIKELE